MKTFKDYVFETITPPSGNTLGPTGPSSTGNTNNAPDSSTNSTNSTNSTTTTTPNPPATPGTDQPFKLEVGAQFNKKTADGSQLSGTISQIDKGANGVKIKNASTGKEEWMNISDLENMNTMESIVSVDRLKQLAGINENSSAGATSAGAIATAPYSVGKTTESSGTMIKREYTPKHAAKTIVGDTKPAQASGQLSATLAANGKKTASRKNNGIKKT